MKLSSKILLTLIGCLSISLVIAILVDQFLVQKILLVNLHNKQIVHLIVAFLGTAIPTALLFWLILEKIILKPIDHLTEVTKDIAGGFLGQKLVIKSNDEFGDLSKNINTIYSNLSKALQNMANSLRDERKKEVALAENFKKTEVEKAKVDAMLSSIGDGVIAIDLDKQVLLFNISATTLSGYLMSEVIGKKYNQLIKFYPEKIHLPTDDIDFSELIIDQIFSGKQAKSSFRANLLTKGGHKLPVEVSIASIKNYLGQNLGAVIVFRDITAEIQLNKMKDEFVSVASHELRTPMTAIKGMISMIFEGDYGPINKDLEEPLTDIQVSVNRLISLVNDLLDLSRIEAGRTRYQLSDISIAGLLKEIVTLFQPLAKQKGIKLELEVEAYQVITTDTDKIKQVVSNLISNSMKFTDKGSITISVHQKNDFVYIFVTDTGIGISTEDQKKLFNKFEQIDSTQNGRPQGTGLGLYISKEYIKRLGGDLWIDKSEVGKGTTFALSLPVAGSEISKKVLESFSKISNDKSAPSTLHG